MIRGGNVSRLSSVYNVTPMPICRRLLKHCVILACSLARDNAGRSKPARMAMMAMTTKSSTSVKPLGRMQRDCFQRYRATTLCVAGAFMRLFFSMIYAEPFVRGSDLSSQWRGQTSDKPHEAHFQCALRINPDDSLAQDC